MIAVNLEVHQVDNPGEFQEKVKEVLTALRNKQICHVNGFDIHPIKVVLEGSEGELVLHCEGYIR